MAKKRLSMMDEKDWLKRANLKSFPSKVSERGGLDDFRTIINFVKQLKIENWDSALALIHIVYAWMPTMIRPIVTNDQEEKDELVRILSQVKNHNKLLTKDELKKVQEFSNRSVVGASKLLHVLNPNCYPIWDQRVANVFLWKGVSRQTFSTIDRYMDYITTIRKWAEDPNINNKCNAIRKKNPLLNSSSNLRIIEFVLFLQ